MQVGITTFGQQKVMIDGHIVSWISTTAERLFYLLLTYPNGLTRSFVTQKLDMSDTALRVAQTRLRQTLTNPDAILEAEGRYALNSIYSQNTDLFLFEDALRQAKRAEDRQQRLRHLYQAASLYMGDFLPGYVEDWAEETRTTLRAAYVRTRIEAASLHCGAVECESAIRNLAGGLASDPLSGERFHRNLMTCLCTMNRADEAVTHYRRFLGFIERDIGDKPTHETLQLAAQIRNGQPHRAQRIDDPLPCPRRLLYGSPSVDQATHHVDIAFLDLEVKRGKQMLTLISKLKSARDWAHLSHHVQNFFDTHMDSTYAWLVPQQSAAPITPNSVPDLDGSHWPTSVVSAFQAIYAAAQTTEGSASPFNRSLAISSYPISKHKQFPSAVLYVVRPTEEPPLTSSDTELLMRIVGALDHIVSQAKWLTDPGPKA